MNERQTIEYIINRVGQSDGDDLERANRAFSHLSKEELDREHGCSGRTRREVWNDCKSARRKHVAAVQWLHRKLREVIE